jgi:hypothetical protein
MNKDKVESIDPFMRKEIKGPDETEEIMSSYVYNRPYVRVFK